jgi:hypothetical protein
VTQGVSPPTNKVTVEIQLGNHLTIDTSAGQNGGTGIWVALPDRDNIVFDLGLRHRDQLSDRFSAG